MIRMLLQIHSSCWQTCPIYFCCLIPCGYWNLSPKGEDIFVNFTDPLTLLRVRASDDLRWGPEKMDAVRHSSAARHALRWTSCSKRRPPLGQSAWRAQSGIHGRLPSLPTLGQVFIWAGSYTWKLVNFNLSRVLCQYHKCRQKVWKALEAAVNVMHGICF